MNVLPITTVNFLFFTLIVNSLNATEWFSLTFLMTSSYLHQKSIVQIHGRWSIRCLNTPDHYCSLDFIDFHDCILFCQVLQLCHLQSLLLLLEMTIRVTSNTVMSAHSTSYRMLMGGVSLLAHTSSACWKTLEAGTNTFHMQLQLENCHVFFLGQSYFSSLRLTQCCSLDFWWRECW